MLCTVQGLSHHHYLGEKGEISCLSLAQLMVGGGTLWTSQGKIAFSPSITDIHMGSAEPPEPPSLGRGRTGQAKTHLSQTWSRPKPANMMGEIKLNEVTMCLKVAFKIESIHFHQGNFNTGQMKSLL